MYAVFLTVVYSDVLPTVFITSSKQNSFLDFTTTFYVSWKRLRIIANLGQHSAVSYQ